MLIAVLALSACGDDKSDPAPRPTVSVDAACAKVVRELRQVPVFHQGEGQDASLKELARAFSDGTDALRSSSGAAKALGAAFNDTALLAAEMAVGERQPSPGSDVELNRRAARGIASVERAIARVGVSQCEPIPALTRARLRASKLPTLG